MRPLNIVRENPVAALAVVAAGIIGCLAAGLMHNNDPVTQPSLVSQPFAQGQHPRRLLPAPVSMADGEVAVLVDPTDTLSRSLNLLPKIRPGMTRVEVEGILGPPAADAIHPVTVTDGQARYRAAYNLGDPDPPATVRPIKPLRLPLPGRANPGAQVALEYDASKPGHPLIEVLYLDPLF